MTQQHDIPVSITSARTGRSTDIRRRQMRYLFSMGVRTACFVLAIIVTGPARWVLVGAAFVLPYIAVVIANAADGRVAAGPAGFESTAAQLGSAGGPAEQRAQTPSQLLEWPPPRQEWPPPRQEWPLPRQEWPPRE